MGTTVDPTGLSFTVTKIDGTTESVSPQTLTPTTWGDTVGTQTCTFTYTDGYDSVSCDVEANVQAVPVVFTGISVSGTPATQRANTQIDTTGLTVYANYSDGSHVDVTSDADFAPDVQGSEIGAWGDCIEYDSEEGGWVYHLTQHYLIASYIGPDDEEYTANSSTFLLEGEVPSGSESFEITTGIGEYKTLDVPQLSSPVEPWDGATGGYLIEGASAGSNAYMVFTKAQYDNDTAVKLEASDPPVGDSYQEAAYLLGPDLEGSSTVPAFGWRVTNGTFRTFVVNSAEGTDGSEFVVVIGTLANAVSPMGAVKKSDFNDGYSYYNFSIIENGP